MEQLTVESSVGQFVVDRPSRARVLEGLGVDYCCGGKKPLSVVCEKHGLDAQEVLWRLLETPEDAEPDADWNKVPLHKLILEIEDRHHAYLRRELPRLWRLVDKVARVHGDKDSKLMELRGIFGGFRVEMDMHMLKEEQVLFPIIQQLERDPTDKPAGGCGSVSNIITQMEHEHDDAGRALERFRELTDGYTPRPDACNTWRVMLDGLRELELETHEHVHKENNILFPRAIETESSGGSGCSCENPAPGDVRVH